MLKKIEMNKFHTICRLILQNRIKNVCSFGEKQIFTQASPLQFQATPALWAEPLRKKKKLDPALIRAREEKKKKKIEKEIRKLRKLEKVFKPVADLEIPECLQENPESRKRNISVSEKDAEERILLLKDWSKLKLKKHNEDVKELHKLMNAQEQALKELRLESEELYQAAVKIDENLLPLKFKGPTETPPKSDYRIPDGNYKDISRKWN